MKTIDQLVRHPSTRVKEVLRELAAPGQMAEPEDLDAMRYYLVVEQGPRPKPTEVHEHSQASPEQIAWLADYRLQRASGADAVSRRKLRGGHLHIEFEPGAAVQHRHIERQLCR